MMTTVKEIKSNMLLRDSSKEISDGKKSLTALLPSLFLNVNQHDIKSEDDLIHV